MNLKLYTFFYHFHSSTAYDHYKIHKIYLHIVVSFVLLFIFGIYLLIVTKLGPIFMKTRNPFNVTPLVRIYNIFQVFVCLIYVSRAYFIGFTFEFLWKCERFDGLNDHAKLEATVGFWLFLLLRIFEFTETFFFVLRKKQKQASFLHIFHHIGSVLMTWLFIVADAGNGWNFYQFRDCSSLLFFQNWLQCTSPLSIRTCTSSCTRTTFSVLSSRRKFRWLCQSLNLSSLSFNWFSLLWFWFTVSLLWCRTAMLVTSSIYRSSTLLFSFSYSVSSSSRAMWRRVTKRKRKFTKR